MVINLAFNQSGLKIAKFLSIFLVLLFVGCTIIGRDSTVVSSNTEKQAKGISLKEKTIDEYLEEQKTSTEFEPEKTISKEALRYYKQARELWVIDLEFGGTRNQEAIKLLKKAIETDPYYHAAHYILGLSYKLIGQLELAEKELFIASSLKPLFSDGHKDLGEVYHELNKLTQAISEYETALELKSEDLYTHFLLGKVYRDKKEYENAIEYFKRAIELTPSYPAALFEMAMTYSGMQDFGNALDTLRRIDNLYSMYEGLGKGLTVYERIYQSNQNNPAFLQNYAYIYFLKHDYKNAIKYFLQSIKINESKFRCNYELGKCFYYNGEYAKAAKYLEKAVKAEPDNYNALMLMGDVYTRPDFKLDYDKAILVYKKAIQVKPDNAKPYHEIAWAFYSKKDYEKAKQYAMKAISLDEKYAKAFRTLGNVNMAEMNFEKALESYEKAIKLYSEQNYRGIYDFDIAWTQCKVGEVYEELGRYDEALKTYKEAYARSNLLFIEDKIADFYLKQDMYPLAIPIYKKRIEENPKASYYHFQLAYTYDKNGQTTYAIEEYEKVLELNPDEYNAHYNLGLIYLNLGTETDLKKMLFHFKKYIQSTKGIEGQEKFRKFAMLQIAARESPLKLKKLKRQGGNIGTLASLLLICLDYNKGNDQFIKGIKETKYESGGYVVSPEVFVAENTFEALAYDIKKVKATDPDIKELIDKQEKAVLLRIEGTKMCGQGFYILRKDYKGEFERGRAKIKIADSYFLEALKGLQQLMKKYKNHFSEYEIEWLSSHINYYATK